jgi:hypothetical protein
MRARLGINNCFAVKCWPEPASVQVSARALSDRGLR